MGQQHRLGRLKVAVAGQNNLLVGLSQVQQRSLEVLYGLFGQVYGLLGKEAHIQGHLVVAGSGRM